MKLFNLMFAIVIAFAFTSCKSGGDKISPEKAAAKFCNCAGPSAELMKKMKNAAAEDLPALAEEAQTIATAMQDCMGGEEEDPTKDMSAEEAKEFGEKVTTAIKAKCADIAEAMGM